MKILESQNAVVSNFEVYHHLVETQARYKFGPSKRKMPGNLATLVTEVLQYLRTAPGPLHDQDVKQNYTPDVISRLFRTLREANLSSELTKGELLSILNMRPNSEALLGTAIEDMEERFNEEEQQKILSIIADVLGVSDPIGGVEEDEAVESVES